MRSLLVSLGLLGMLCAPLRAEEEGGHWFLDVHTLAGTLDGHYHGLQNNEPMDVDLKGDLGLAADGNKPGAGLEYQGHRFGLELAANEADFKGSQVVTKTVTINGQSFSAGAKVTSAVVFKTYTLNWTIRALTFEHAWIGIDLGVRAISLDLTAHGVEGFTNITADAAYKGTLPLPQVGLSAGLKLMNNRILARAFYHTLNYSGASFVVTGADVRVFPLSWLGLMAFTNQAKLNVPQGAISDSANVVLNQNGSGGGIVFRF